MRLTHNSRQAQFRAPYGAVTVGTQVTLRIQVTDADPERVDIILRIWVDGNGEQLVPMEHECEGFFKTMLVFDEPEIVWYTFIAQEEGQPRVRLGATQGRTGGEGMLYGDIDAPSFQITVYEPRTVRPSWYEQGIVYQIFPDRYRRDEDWRERTEAALDKPYNSTERRIVEDWDTPPTYERHRDGSIKCWDFYGGSLKGIEEDLPRLAEMGVTAIYLNPIFEAASNHRYDTGDYLKIDPALGTEEDFEHLCASAEERGISIILDGVFNHTGDDSRYFNRYRTYPEPGAWQALHGKDSKWADAYNMDDDGDYASWWGIQNMPQLNPHSQAVQELILGDDGVIRHWLRAGAHGWRLDVADELTEDMIRGIRSATLDTKPDGLVLGEVWEDASNKISYGKPRHYLLGDELDSAMNYPFREMILGFLTGKTNAFDAAETIERLRENYPPEALACCLNLLSSHDRTRVFSVLGGAPDTSGMTEEERGAWKVPDNMRGLAKSRYWLAVLMQMTLPGVPCIYYGDEAGVEGLTDPYNRSTYPWGHEDPDMMVMTRNAIQLRRTLSFLRDGTISARALNDDVLTYTRSDGNGQGVTFVFNRSSYKSHVVTVSARSDHAHDLISGADMVPNASGNFKLLLNPLGARAIYTHPEQRLQKKLEPGTGVICHITSMPNEGGHPGTLGEPAKRFVDHLAAMGMRYWQVLPVNPADGYRSPYAGPSAFAGNIDLLDTDRGTLFLEFEELDHEGALEWDEEFQAFAKRNAEWLKPYCAFQAVKDSREGASRHTWPDELKRYDEALLEDPAYRKLARFHMYCQYRFDVQWHELLDYAHERGVMIIGDIPMYVSDDSADAWSRPELFHLDADGRATQIAGCPPDQFAEDGQIWGNPTYRWSAHAKDGYSWWIARLRRMLDLYDYVRLDHFLGFQSYFSIPAGGTGADGRWVPGPGIELFQRAHDELGPLPFIAEDLGIITPAVRALTVQCGFPGMDVLQFTDYDVRSDIRPHRGKVLYTSTHDTSTLAGWCQVSFCREGDRDGAIRLASDIMKRALESEANVVMLSLQDVLGLGDEARMNVPSTAHGNWSWQAEEKDVAGAEKRMHRLLRETGRSTEEV